MATQKIYDINNMKVQEMYNVMRELYISKYNKKFAKIAEEITRAYTAGGIQRTSEDTYNKILLAMKSINLNGADNLPSFNGLEGALNELKKPAADAQKRLDNLKTVVDTFSLIDKYLKTNNNQSLPSNIVTGINRFETLLAGGKVTSKYRGQLGPMSDFYGTINNMVGGLAEVYASVEVEEALNSPNFNIELSGQNRVNMKLNKKLTLANVVDSRDIKVNYKKGKVDLMVGISVKKYSVDQKGSVNIKLRQSNFNVVYKYLSSGGTSTFPIGKMLTHKKLSEMFTVGIHEYKKYGANARKNDDTSSGFSNIKEIIDTIQKISGMALLDMLLGQGSFDKMGLQMLMLNGELLNFSHLFPTGIPHATGLSPAELNKVSPLGSGNPSYDAAIDNNSYDNYLARYNSLNLVLRETINIAKMKKK